MLRNRSKEKAVTKLPINGKHSWLSNYGTYKREAAIERAAENSRVERETVGAILDARTEFLAAMKMETPYKLPGSPTYARLRQLSADFVDGDSVEEGILHFPDLADYVAQRTGASMGLILKVLADDSDYIHECTGLDVALGLANWAAPQIRAGRIALDELKRALAAI